MRWRLLGPIGLCTEDGGWARPGAAKLRVLLAVLLTEPGRVVSTERLISELWADADPPAGCRKLVSQYVFRLRQLIGDPAGRVLVTEPPGYRLTVADGALDAERFAGRLTAAQAALADQDADRAANLAGEALGMWCGPALADVPRGPLVAAEAHRLDELRLDAQEVRAEAALAQGQAPGLVAELRGLTSSHPLRERFWLLLMRALDDTGRPAEALAAYAQARQVLADELGADPSPELQQLHHRLLTREPPAAERSGQRAPVVPRQLPNAAGNFVGRAAELRRLSGLLDEGSGGPSAVVISAIGGTAGVGKTALAVRWAHQAAGRFPDGQLYVNLRGYDPDQPVSAADALASFLRGLGVPGPEIPAEIDERAARYRSLLAGRRLLVLLDNASSAKQVRPLLPGTPGCMAVVTSRDDMAGLVARDGAIRLDLDLLPEADAVRLLRGLIGARAADHAPTHILASQCARLPLALRVAAELAAARPAISLSELAAELADQQHRLERLDAGGDQQTAVRAVFSWSVQHLEPAAARLFRLAGLHPGPDLDRYAAAALTGSTLEHTEKALRRLTSAHLIQPAQRGRYGLHDLLRAYARELATCQEAEDEQHAALTRLFDYYLHTAAAAMDTLVPARHDRWRPPVPPSDSLVPRMLTADEGQAWLDAELTTLTGVAGYTAGHGWDRHATQLAAVLFRYLQNGGHYTEAYLIHDAARRAARQLGDPAAEALALDNLAGVHWYRSQHLQARKLARQALRLSREAADRSLEARVLNNTSLMDKSLGRIPEATADLQQALTLYRESGDRIGEALVLSGLSDINRWAGRYEQAGAQLAEARELLAATAGPHDYMPSMPYILSKQGRVAVAQGRYTESIGYQQQAIALFRRQRNVAGEAESLAHLGQAHLRQGDAELALDLHRRALALARDLRAASWEAGTLNGMGEIYLATGRPEQAREVYASALALASQTGAKWHQADAHNGLGHACRALGAPAQARAHWRRALALYTALAAHQADQVQNELDVARHLSFNTRRHDS